ncbi:MAG: hypothetical protein QXR21_04490 [Thermoplasmatales archaeon]
MRWFIIWGEFIDYRSLEGIMRKLFHLDIILKYPDLSTIWNRIHLSVPEISLPQFDEEVIATYGSGLKTSNTGKYRILKYGDKDARKHLIIVIMAGVKRKKLLCMSVCIERKRYMESPTALQLISSIMEKDIRIKKFYGDVAFDQSPCSTSCTYCTSSQ